MASLPTVQAMQLAAQATSAVNAVRGTTEESNFNLGGLNPLGMNPLGMCKPSKVEEAESEVDEAVDPVGPPPESLSSYTLRMCVFSGTNLLRERSYVVMTIGEGSQHEKSLQGPVAPQSANPVWEWDFDSLVEVGGQAPMVSIKVFAKRLIKDALIGACAIRLPSVPTDGPLKQTLDLKNVPSHLPGLTSPSSKLTIAWQFCEATGNEPDLIRVAEMDTSALQKRPFDVEARIHSLHLRRPSRKPETVFVKVILVKKGGQKALPVRMPPVVTTVSSSAAAALGTQSVQEEDATSLVSTTTGATGETGESGETGETGTMGSSGASAAKDSEKAPSIAEARAKKESDYNEAHWSSESGDGWQLEKWTIEESQVSLLSYVMQVEAYLANSQSEQHGSLIGRWTEPVANLLDAINEHRQKIRFDAELSQTDGHRTALLRMELDIYSGMPHGPLKPLPRAKLQRDDTTALRMKGKSIQREVPLRKGIPEDGEGNRQVSFFCTLFAQGLPANCKNRDIYFRITVGSCRVESIRLTYNKIDLEWPEPLKVVARARDKKAVVEMWMDNASFFGDRDELIGETAIYNVALNNTYWCQCYGGALGAPKADQALQMVKGAVRPASTHRVTTAVHFGLRPRPSLNFWKELKAERKPCRLLVRLHRGLYFNKEQFGGRHVNVLVQLAGGHLPDYCKDEEENILNFNRSVLSFPGVVSKEGILTFVPTEELSWGDVWRKAIGGQADDTCAWVERSTPNETPLQITADVSHVYLYVVAVGDEDKPPKIFGQLNLDRNEKGRPAWQPLHWDVSVVDLPKAHFQSDLAGYLLGSAVLIPSGEGVQEQRTLSGEAVEVDESLEKVLPRTTRPMSMMLRPFVPEMQVHVGSVGQHVRYQRERPELKRIVYCHMDVLAARALPATDEDGLSDPAYTIYVQDKKMQVNKGVPKSLNPTFMHRYVIPIEVEVEPSCATEMLPQELAVPLPPVLFKLRDRDALGAVDVFTDVATVVVEQPKILDMPCCFNAAGIDVNAAHEAFWHALDSTGSTPFDVGAGGIDPAWRPHPRVLLAAGYSLHGSVPGVTDTKDAEGRMLSFSQTVPESEKFLIKVDLLGLRNIPEAWHDPQLVVSSFWEGDPVCLQLDNSANPNFIAEDDDGQEWESFANRMKPMFKITRADDDETDDEHEVQTSTATKMDLEDILGVRVLAPVYTVPIIPYLQIPLKRKSRSIVPSNPKRPFVLMPDLVFQLRSSLLKKVIDLGSLSLQLPLGPVSDRRLENWNEQSLDSFKKLPSHFQSVQTLEQTQILEDAYSVFVDIFAADEGYLRWNPEVRMGRSLKQQHLFTISKGKSDSDDDENGAINQYFDPGDWMSNDPRFADEPFDNRVTPALRCAAWDSEAHSFLSTRDNLAHALPVGKEDLFKDYLESSKTLATDLDNVSTYRLRKRLQADGWRCMSHLTAPEKLPDTFPSLQAKNASLKKNLHTFMRGVGHIIDPNDRDSKFLARLRVCLPKHVLDQSDEEERQALIETQENLVNFLVVKFSRPGTIIWSQPQHVDVWDTPGQMLFAVQLSDGSGTVVPVHLPVFDLRFPFETAWFPVKTLTSRWRTLENRIKRKESTQERQHANKRKKPVVKAPSVGDHGQDDIEEGRMSSSDDEDNIPSSDGYSQPIFVSKNAFVCRIQKRVNTHNFDRSRTTNWYRSVLQSVFQDVRELETVPDGDYQHVKKLFFGKFLNLRRSLVTGEAHEGAGLIKGHVSVQRLDSKDAGAALAHGAPEGRIPHWGMRPVEHLWTRRSVNANLYVLTGRHLNLDGIGHGIGHGRLKPYLKVEVLGSEKHTSPVIEDMTVGNTVDFYQHVPLTTVLPGDSTLRIQVWNKGVLGFNDTLIGTVELDLEDRWLVLDRRRTHARANAEHLELNISPPKETSVGMPSPSASTRPVWKAPQHPCLLGNGDASVAVEPRLSPLPQLPIETMDLLRNDEETGSQMRVGALRLWVDMAPEGESYSEAKLKAFTQEFEIRVTVWDVTGISVFKDFGEHNDVVVKGKLLSCNAKGVCAPQKRQTDVHKFAHSSASFNWRWVFPVSAPTNFCALELSLEDKDLLSEHDLIYEKKTLPLDHMLMLALDNYQDGRPLGINSEKVVFDAWPKRDIPPATSSRRCCLRRRAPTKPKPATLKVDIQILPKQDADLAPVSEGQISEPSGRLTWNTAVADPVRAFRQMVGPTNWRTGSICCCGTVTALIALVLFAILYLIVNTFVKPFQ